MRAWMIAVGLAAACGLAAGPTAALGLAPLSLSSAEGTLQFLGTEDGIPAGATTLGFTGGDPTAFLLSYTPAVSAAPALLFIGPGLCAVPICVPSSQASLSVGTIPGPDGDVALRFSTQGPLPGFPPPFMPEVCGLPEQGDACTWNGGLGTDVFFFLLADAAPGVEISVVARTGFDAFELGRFTVVPEPSAWMLLGLAGLAAARRSRAWHEQPHVRPGGRAGTDAEGQPA